MTEEDNNGNRVKNKRSTSQIPLNAVRKSVTIFTLKLLTEKKSVNTHTKVR